MTIHSENVFAKNNNNANKKNYKKLYNFNDDDGTKETSKIPVNKKIKKLIKPSRVGYTFEGWFTDENIYENKIEAGQQNKIEGDFVLYPKLTKNIVKFTKPLKNIAITADYGMNRNSFHYGIDLKGFPNEEVYSISTVL